MGRKSSETPLRKISPALTPEAREKQLISLAVNEAEKRILDGSASNQLLIHFLKLASSREQLEREKLEKENELLRARTEALESSKRVEELYSEAIAAFKSYAMEDFDDSEV